MQHIHHCTNFLQLLAAGPFVIQKASHPCFTRIPQVPASWEHHQHFKFQQWAGSAEPGRTGRGRDVNLQHPRGSAPQTMSSEAQAKPNTGRPTRCWWQAERSPTRRPFTLPLCSCPMPFLRDPTTNKYHPSFASLGNGLGVCKSQVMKSGCLLCASVLGCK